MNNSAGKNGIYAVVDTNEGQEDTSTFASADLVIDGENSIPCDKIDLLPLFELSSSMPIDKDFSKLYLVTADFRDSDLTNSCFAGANVSFSDLTAVNFTRSKLVNAIFRGANLEKACLLEADLSFSDFSVSNFSGANLKSVVAQKADLEEVNLTGADLTGADLRGAILALSNLRGANLTNANLTGANLIASDLTGATLTGAIGLGTREEEVQFAKDLLALILSGQGSLRMERYHSDPKTHSLEGWAFKDDPSPGPKASLKYPTLARFFLVDDDIALAALSRVASGELSVFL
jgi:uncharacterized protein YjbI with pentapeptide repeats